MAIPEAHRADQQLAALLMKRSKGQVSFPQVCQVEVPSEGKCESCGRLWAECSVSLVPGTIFHLLAPLQTHVQIGSCPCGRVWHYDGRSDGILNFNNKYLFSYEILEWRVLVSFVLLFTKKTQFRNTKPPCLKALCSFPVSSLVVLSKFKRKP
jgi:hypothetical protein